MTLSPALQSAWDRFDASFLPDHGAREAEIAALRARWRALHYAFLAAPADEAKRIAVELNCVEADLISVRLDAVEALEECAAEARKAQSLRVLMEKA